MDLLRNGNEQDARIAELVESIAHCERQRDEEITRNLGLGERITELEAELQPFRDDVAAYAAEAEAQADGAASPPAQVAKPKK